MRVGILSSPMLFQRNGEVQHQVRQTIAALNRPGAGHAHRVQVQMLDPHRDRLNQFDLIHVFSATGGHARLVEVANEMALPVVLSPLLSPGWNRASGQPASAADNMAGRLRAWNTQTGSTQAKCAIWNTQTDSTQAKRASWDTQTCHAQVKRALQLSQLVIAFDAAERAAIMAGFRVDGERIRTLTRNPARHCSMAPQDLFRDRTGIAGPFVLMVGPVAPHGNQLGMVQALEGLNLPVMLVGRVSRHDRAWLATVLRAPAVRWLGDLRDNDPLLTSAYHAASVVALACHDGAVPQAALDSLAAGTPVVMTDSHALGSRGDTLAVRTVRCHDGQALRHAVSDLVAHPPGRDAVRTLVDHYSWRRVAAQVFACYAELAARERPPTEEHATAPSGIDETKAAGTAVGIAAESAA
jgi:hypothetical protein